MGAGLSRPRNEIRNRMKYQVLQLTAKTCPDFSKKIFTSLKGLSYYGLSPVLSEYQVEDTGTIEWGNRNPKDICEELFSIYNFRKPEGFYGHSMSVSDIIFFPETGEYYYCDLTGFELIRF